MKGTHTYLIFDGNCREAMTFYQQCLGGDLHLSTFGEAPGGGCPEGGSLPKGTENRIMHACLTQGPVLLMASDNMPGMPFTRGNNFSISINCETIPETEKFFKALNQQAQNITMPLGETFWAVRFGMLTDKFGINWMFNLGKSMETASAKTPAVKGAA